MPISPGHRASKGAGSVGCRNAWARRVRWPARSAITLLRVLGVGSGCGSGQSRLPATRPPEAVLPAVLINDSLGVEDRCTSCHAEVLDASHTLAPEPHTAHPGRLLELHPPRRFGCTPCHGGDGRAVTAVGAHAPGAGYPQFLTGYGTEIACGKCHLDEQDLDGAPHLSRGRALIRRSHCDGCHQIGEFARSGRPGPDLTGIASRTNPAWLFRWIKNPRDYASNARMPRFELEDRYVDALVGYLMTFRSQAPFDTTGYPPGDATRGGNLLRLSFCISCHSIEDKGGTGAIDLGRVGNKLGRPELLRLLSETHEVDPATSMPQYRFTRAQVADLAAYLDGQLVDPSFDTADGDSALGRLGAFWASDSQRVEVGRRVFKELRCGNCHMFPGGEGWIRVAPILSRIGDKSVADIAWGRTRFPRTLPDYVWHKVETPHVYETAPYRLKMPSYDFAPDEARDVTIALLAQTDLPVVSDPFVVRARSDDTLSLGGEFGRLVSRYRCLSCHSMNGVGHNLAYDLGVEGSRVRKEWIYRYLKLPYTVRPILTLRMPVFNLTDEEAHALSDGLTSTMTDARIDSAGEFTTGPSEVQAGRVLFEQSGCQSCHQIGSKGGYVGPSFTSGAAVRDKLRPGWIVCWLESPQTLKPDVIEPRYGFTRAQARALAAYLLSLPGEKGGAR
jgi:mono/diheme cytochrome c family protein